MKPSLLEGLSWRDAFVAAAALTVWVCTKPHMSEPLPYAINALTGIAILIWFFEARRA